MTVLVPETPHAIVIGSGLAGLTAALHVLDRGGRVVLFEKEAKPGGNSVKASSGINACARDDSTQPPRVPESEIDAFLKDTIQSAGENANPELIATLVHNSVDALQWLKDRVGVDLTQSKTQLGGHSSARTHRPEKGAVGFTVISALQKVLKPFEESGHLELRTSTRVIELQRKGDNILAVKCVTTAVDGTEEITWMEAPHVILATGGFAADRSSDSLLANHCPEYIQMPATFGDFSTGDGIKIAAALGAATCNLDKVQVHPTGFVDPANPSSNSKFLCAELMRGLGGILLNAEGQRFCNELGTRSYVTDKMFQHEPHYATTRKWDSSLPIPVFTLVLSSQAAKGGGEHIGFYTWKQLMRPCKGISGLAEYMNVPVESLKKSLIEYRKEAMAGSDSFGKTVFPNVFSENLDEEEFFAGQVTPVLHYCMGGLATDSQGNVLNEDKEIIEGLHATGEVVGGVHGDNRLAGNSLLECLVFGTIIGKKIPIASE